MCSILWFEWNLPIFQNMQPCLFSSNYCHFTPVCFKYSAYFGFTILKLLAFLFLLSISPILGGVTPIFYNRAPRLCFLIFLVCAPGSSGCTCSCTSTDVRLFPSILTLSLRRGQAYEYHVSGSCISFGSMLIHLCLKNVQT